MKKVILCCLSLLAALVFAVPSYASSGKTFVFDPQEHKWFAYEGNELVKSGVASGGSNYCADLHRACHTPVGNFRVMDKGGPECVSTIFPLSTHGGAPMPWCMHFTKFYAIHGSYEVVPGRNVSHGCIRVYPKDANWLSHNFIDVGTSVIVKPY